MSGIYYDNIADVLRAAGLVVKVEDVNAGWENRARSSGGFPSPPLGVIWHHTASQTSPQNDLNYMIHNCPDEPVGNMLLDRDGVVWPIAAGAANTAGKGGPYSFSRGTVPLDSGNTRTWNIEAANNGVGGPWPQAQIDAYFIASNALNAHFGNLPSDLATHQAWAPDRKIDPATASAVQGPWVPGSINSSGTWNLDYIIGEASHRASGGTPPPEPEPEPPKPPGWKDDDVLHVITEGRGAAIVGPGYWHYARNPDEAFVWQKLYGPPIQLDNSYDYDTLMRTMALEPDDASQLGPGA
jgi:hypothetical protein